MNVAKKRLRCFVTCWFVVVGCVVFVFSCNLRFSWFCGLNCEGVKHACVPQLFYLFGGVFILVLLGFRRLRLRWVSKGPTSPNPSLFRVCVLIVSVPLLFVFFVVFDLVLFVLLLECLGVVLYLRGEVLFFCLSCLFVLECFCCLCFLLCYFWYVFVLSLCLLECFRCCYCLFVLLFVFVSVCFCLFLFVSVCFCLFLFVSFCLLWSHCFPCKSSVFVWLMLVQCLFLIVFILALYLVALVSRFPLSVCVLSFFETQEHITHHLCHVF